MVASPTSFVASIHDSLVGNTTQIVFFSESYVTAGASFEATLLNPAIAQKHIMLSYNWDHKPIVHAIYQTLKSIGHDVWVNDFGSSVVPKMSENSDQRIAEAAEESEFVVIVVSPKYKESVAYEKGTQYASQKKKHIIFVMFYPNYITVSSPNTVSGWLGLMIGTQIWYPCYNITDTTALAHKLACETFKGTSKF